MNTYLFALTITPVQSFISQARKTKDLYYSSLILSDLMMATLEKVKEQKGEIIFPQNNSGISNKLIAKFVDKTDEEIKGIGKEFEDGVNKAFITLVFKATNTCDNGLNNFFKVFWTAQNLAKGGYKQLEQNLSAIKNLRTFSQNTQEVGKSKCVLCGERNVYGEDDKDKLCIVCYAKRKYKNESFPSLAKICLLDWLKDVDYNELKKLNGFDEEWFLAEPKKDEVAQFIKNNKLDVSKQKKQYALLHFDVDSLGKKLSELDEKGQRELSKKLGEFAAKASKIVDEAGKTVYAGGDDFLGFVNLADLPDTICEIKNAFNIEGLTFSASIVIAHYKAPLHKVLDFSRELLDSAKRHFDDKNGIGIMAMNSNAIVSQTICRYEDLRLLDKLKKAEIAKNIHFKLHTTFDYLGAMSYDEYMTQKEMIGVEIKRLMKREDGDFDQKLYDELIGFFGKQYKELAANSYKIDFDNFMGYLKTLEQLRGAM